MANRSTPEDSSSMTSHQEEIELLPPIAVHRDSLNTLPLPSLCSMRDACVGPEQESWWEEARYSRHKRQAALWFGERSPANIPLQRDLRNL